MLEVFDPDTCVLNMYAHMQLTDSWLWPRNDTHIRLQVDVASNTTTFAWLNMYMDMPFHAYAGPDYNRVTFKQTATVAVDDYVRTTSQASICI